MLTAVNSCVYKFMYINIYYNNLWYRQSVVPTLMQPITQPKGKGPDLVWPDSGVLGGERGGVMIFGLVDKVISKANDS